MSAFVSPTYLVSKNIGRHVFASYQRIQPLTNINSSLNLDSFSENLKPRDTDSFSEHLKPRDTFTDPTTSPAVFKNISVITPKTSTRFFYNEFKLKFVAEQEKSNPGVELLRNIAAKYDYWMVRKNQAHLLYYRLEMMLQRIAYFKTIGLDSKQKLRQIQKKPPLLLFTFSDRSYSGNLIYLRGLLSKGTDFINLFYPVSCKITANKITIQDRINTVEDELKLKQPAVIRELLHMPCFFMHPKVLKGIKHMFIYKYSMPYYYSVDKHTAQVLPPICRLADLGLSSGKHLGVASSNTTIASLPTYKLANILDTSYPTNNGTGTPECLSTFLLRAELEEEKDRTGGQPLKGRRGFNMPPRQY